MDSLTQLEPIAHSTKSTYLPQEVVEKTVVEGKSLLQAWREYRHMTHQEIADRMGISPAVICVLEKPNNRVSRASMQKFAIALDVTVEQLTI